MLITFCHFYLLMLVSQQEKENFILALYYRGLCWYKNKSVFCFYVKTKELVGCMNLLINDIGKQELFGEKSQLQLV